MATLTYNHFGNPDRSYHRAHYSTQVLNNSLAFLPFLPSILRNYSARKWQFNRLHSWWQHAIGGGFFILTIY